MIYVWILWYLVAGTWLAWGVDMWLTPPPLGVKEWGLIVLLWPLYGLAWIYKAVMDRILP